MDFQVVRAVHETQFIEVVVVVAQTAKAVPEMNLITCKDLITTVVMGMVL